MRTHFTIFLGLIFFIAKSQDNLKISSGISLVVNDDLELYADLNLLNEGTVKFDNTGNLTLDAGFDNQNAEALILNNAVLHLGSDTPRAEGIQTAVFGNNDEAKKVELGMHSGTYNVTGGQLNITETFTSNSGTLNANDRVVLKSTSFDNTAIVPESSGGAVNGIRVERFISANRSFRFLASPVNTSGSSKSTIEDNWQQGGLDVGNPGYRANVGTHITGGDETDGFDQNDSGLPSLSTFDNSTGTYTAVSSANSSATNVMTLEIGEPYSILVRGDRSIDLMINDDTETTTTLEATGSLAIGNQTPVDVSTTGTGGFILIANPYQAPVDLDAVLGSSTNIAATTDVFVWDPQAGSNFQKGQFATIDNTGMNNLMGSDADRILQPGQSVFVEATNPGNPVEVNFTESDKLDLSDLTDVFSTGSNQNLDGFLRIGLYPPGFTPFVDVAKDGFIVQFDDAFENAIDQDDGTKAFGNSENMSVLLNNEYISINSRKLPDDLSETIEIYTTNLEDTQYTVAVELQGLQNLPNGIMLWDKYEDTYTTLSDQQTIPFDVDQSIPGSIANDRFALVFENENLGIENQELSHISLYPNPVIEDDFTIEFTQNESNKTEIVIFSQTGQIVFERTYTDYDNKIKIENLDYLQEAPYILNVQQGDREKSFTILKK